jgi:hypothetical protein
MYRVVPSQAVIHACVDSFAWPRLPESRPSLEHIFAGMWAVPFLMPDAVQSLQVALDAVTEYTAESWGAVFREPGGSIPWVILDSLVLGIIVSGLPLFCSWIGQVLATRCVATLPRRRFRVMTGLVSLGFASAALAICLTPQPFEDEQEVALDLQVVDEVTDRPINAAFVCITDPFSHDSPPVPPRALTDNDGRARLTGRFVVHGERNAFRTMGLFSPWGRWLEVSAAGHGIRRIPLTEVLGQFADPARPIPRKVALARGEARADSFHDLAGVYTDGGRGFGGRWFEIKSDGRFAWCEWGCVPPDSQEYGYLKRHDKAIELVPVPHPGRDIDPHMAVEHRAIEWGARLYISPADQHELREFCRAALAPNHLSNSEYVKGTYLRESDRDRPRNGQPQLPMEVWVKFLTDELSLNNEEGSLRLALDSLIARHPREGRSPTDGLQR